MTRRSHGRAPAHAGRTFGKYRTLAVLGHGGMATVYLANAVGPGNFSKLVVVKELRPELAEDPDFRTMFLAEARLAARLHHANVVQTYEVLEADGSQVIVMEYLEGQPLSRVRHRLASMGDSATYSMLRILADALAGLHYAHELTDYDGTPLRVVHRDVSPHNIFVTYAGEVKVVDFGVAKVGASSIRTATGVIKGKLSYMAPEQALGLKVDRRADVFAAGLILWEIVTGTRVWRDLEDVVILSRLNAREIPKIREAKPDVAPEVERILNRALAPMPDDRYATAAQMRHDIENYLAKLPDRVRARDVGEIVSEAFAEERRKIRSLVENEMRFAADMTSGEYAAHPLAVIEQPRASTSTMTEVPEPGSVRSQVTVVERTGGSGARVVSGSAVDDSIATRPNTLPSATTSAPSKRGPILIGAGLVVAVALGFGAALALRRPPETAGGPIASSTVATPPPTVSAIASAPEPRPSTTPKQVTLRIKVVPPTATAKVYLDDAPITTNPPEAKVAADGATHRVRAEAPGYLPATESVVAEGDDKDVKVELKRKGGAKKGGGDDGGKVDLGFLRRVWG